MNPRDRGILFVLLERLRTQRLPRLLALRRRVTQGARLDMFDLHFLHEAINDSVHLSPRWSRHPEFRGIFGPLALIYHEITSHALRNELAMLHGSSNNPDRRTG